MQETIANLQQYLSGFWLKRRYLLLAVWVICPVGWLAVTLLPNVYQSEARIYADTRSILQPLLKGLAIQSDPKQELELMVKTLLSRSNLERIARTSDADISVSSDRDYEELLLHLKNTIAIKTTRQQDLYTISYENKDPVLVKNVVEAALNVFVENTLGEKRIDTDNANQFINQQIEEYEIRLVESEKRLADFKRENIGYFPGSDRSYYDQVQSFQSQLELTQLELSEAESRLNAARQQLREEENLATRSSSGARTEFDNRIDLLESRLDDLLLRYTTKHPNVAETQSQIRLLKAEREASFSSPRSISEMLSNNPVYQEMKITVGLLGNDVASLKVRQERYANKVLELQSKLSLVPDVEAQLAGLNRNYSITKSKYEELLARRESALISQNAGQNTDDIKFRVIDPPRIPNEPSGPMRPLFLFAVLIVGYGVGSVLSLLMSQINPVVTSTNHLYQVTGLPVFGFVSATEVSEMEHQEKAKRRWFILGNSLILITFVLAFYININQDLHDLVTYLFTRAMSLI